MSPVCNPTHWKFEVTFDIQFKLSLFLSLFHGFYESDRQSSDPLRTLPLLSFSVAFLVIHIDAAPSEEAIIVFHALPLFSHLRWLGVRSCSEM